MPTAPQPPLHHVLDWEYTLESVLELLDAGEDADLAAGPLEETPLHIAVRRFRPPSV